MKPLLFVIKFSLFKFRQATSWPTCSTSSIELWSISLTQTGLNQCSCSSGNWRTTPSSMSCSSPSSPSLWLQAFGNTQGMLSYLPCTTADVEALGSLVHPAIAAFKSGQELPPSPYLSKTLQPTSQPWQQLSHRTRQWTPGTSWSSASIKGSGSSTRSTVITSSLQDVHHDGAQAQGSKLQVSSWRESKGWEW